MNFNEAIMDAALNLLDNLVRDQFRMLLSPDSLRILAKKQTDLLSHDLKPVGILAVFELMVFLQMGKMYVGHDVVGDELSCPMFTAMARIMSDDEWREDALTKIREALYQQ